MTASAATPLDRLREAAAHALPAAVVDALAAWAQHIEVIAGGEARKSGGRPEADDSALLGAVQELIDGGMERRHAIREVSARHISSLQEFEALCHRLRRKLRTKKNG